MKRLRIRRRKRSGGGGGGGLVLLLLLSKAEAYSSGEKKGLLYITSISRQRVVIEKGKQEKLLLPTV